MEVADGAEFIPKVVCELRVVVLSVDLHRPTLDDVFLKLTGRAIRDAEANPLNVRRLHGRLWGRGGR
jgi:ABC-2 type transport system ATP-binding protein